MLEENSRKQLERKHGKVWTTDQLRAEFEVHAFLAPFVEVTRKSDHARGTMSFTHMPRFYFAFVEDNK